MKVFITGGAGTCGSILKQLPYEKIFFDKIEKPNFLKSEFYVKGNLTQTKLISKHIKGCNVLIHLAASDYYPDFKNFPQYSLYDYHKNNIDNLSLLFKVAISSGVEKIIFASSHRVMGLYEKDHAPEIYTPNHKIMIDEKFPIRPDSFYALTKIFGENFGHNLVREKKCSFQVIRICSVRSEIEDHPFAYADMGVKLNLWKKNSLEYNHQVDRLRGLWQSRRDFLNMTSLIVKKDQIGFDVFFGVSDNKRRWFDLTNAKQKLGYDSLDDSESYISSP